MPDATAHPAAAWAARTVFGPEQIDCTTAVMLKILDGKCRMFEAEKQAVAAVYAVVRDQPGARLDAAVHALIAQAQAAPGDPALVEAVYERRVLAETAISRPVMKAYKAWLRAEGVIGGEDPAAAD